MEVKDEKLFIEIKDNFFLLHNHPHFLSAFGYSQEEDIAKYRVGKLKCIHPLSPWDSR